MVCFILQPPPGVDREPVSFIAPGPCPLSQSQRTTDLCSLRRGGESIGGSGWDGGGHPRHRVAHIPPQTLGSGTSPFQGVKTVTRGSDTSRCQAIYLFFDQIKSTSPSVSISKRHSEARTVVGVRTSTWVRAGGCRLCLQWPTHKKERMKERKKGRKTTPLPRCLSDGK